MKVDSTTHDSTMDLTVDTKDNLLVGNISMASCHGFLGIRYIEKIGSILQFDIILNMLLAANLKKSNVNVITFAMMWLCVYLYNKKKITGGVTTHNTASSWDIGVLSAKHLL